MPENTPSVEVLEDHGGGENSLGAWVPETKDTRRYQLRHFLPEGAVASGPMFHKPGGVLDQSSSDSCVGHAGRGLMLGEPNPAKRDALDDTQAQIKTAPFTPATLLYFGAQQNDEWAGGQYPGASPQYGGSSIHGLIKYMVAQKLVSGPYAWASSPADLRAWLRNVGGVCFASRWAQDMFHPVNGYVHPTGAQAGGHAYYMFGVDANDDIYCMNSWGKWGIGVKFTNPDGSTFTVPTGVFRITPQDQQTLFNLRYAEGVAPVKVVASPPEPDRLKQLREAKKRIVGRIQTREKANTQDRARLDTVNEQIAEITGG